MFHQTVPASVLAILAMGPHMGGLIFARAEDAVVEQYRERQDELIAASQTILAQADAEKRELTAEENRQIDENSAEFERLRAEIERRERIAAQAAQLYQPQGRQTDPEPADPEGADDPEHAPPRVQNRSAPAPERRPAPRPAAQVRPFVAGNGNAGFRSFGDFAQAVRNAAQRGGEVDQRLIRNAASTWSGETTGADGGFAVPPDFRSEIMAKVFAEDSLIGRSDRLTSSSNTITLPIDMTTPWQTTGGVQAYWESEAAAITQSKIALEQQTIRLHKLAALVPVTEELLEDAPSLDGYLRRKVPEKMDFKVSNALVWGSGSGQPLGFMNADCLVTQAAESGQTADTITVANIVKMFSRMPVQSRQSAVWLIHPDAEPQLPLMTIGNQPVYMPPGGVSSAPYGTLLGRPVIPHQVCKTVGDLGDIMFADFRQYMSATKGGGIRTDVSMHLWFDQDLLAYRFIIRVAGQPWWSASTPSLNGSHTQSPFVALAAR